MHHQLGASPWSVSGCWKGIGQAEIGEGEYVPDLVATFGSLDIIIGEVDRSVSGYDPWDRHHGARGQLSPTCPAKESFTRL
jgi:hypothetical protein